jgi:hypothetical protein
MVMGQRHVVEHTHEKFIIIDEVYRDEWIIVTVVGLAIVFNFQ